MNPDACAPLVAALLNPRLYPQPVDDVQHLETHISHVFLAGDHAYKLKKPLNLGFLDFSNLAARQHCCAEEIRLNRRLAPALYLGCLALVAEGKGWRLVDAAQAPSTEWLVHMRRFDPALQFDQLMQQHTLSPHHIDALAQDLARFHRSLPPSPAPYGNLAAVAWPVRENFSQIRPHLETAADIAALDRLAQQAEAELQRLTPLLAQRQSSGFIRECHGDLHLGNIALVDGHPRPFDGLEFNPELRHIDIMSEMAFLSMDLQHRDRPDLAARCLNHWLEITGDYAGLAVLPFYQAYRAMVRAKVARLRAAQTEADEAEKALVEYRQYIAHAGRVSPKPALILTHGVSASGKTHVSQILLQGLGAIRLRSDVERKRLFGLDARARSGTEDKSQLYGAAASRRTYDQLLDLSSTLLQAGHTVIVDAAFLRREQRAPFLALAGELGVACCIVHCHAARNILEQRIQARQLAAQDASEADQTVLQQQWHILEPLNAMELALSLSLDTGSLTESAQCKTALITNVQKAIKIGLPDRL